MKFILIFIFTFIIYTFTSFPTVAPYRDAGEMATVVPTLSIAHPPGYPTYILFGNIFLRLIPFGDIAYRLNIFSALCSALSSVLIFQIILKLFGSQKLYIIFFSIFPFAFSYLQWYLSLVQEMYTLGIFFASLIVLLLLYNKLTLAIFLFGLGLGNRMDLLFLLPGIFVYKFKAFIKNLPRISLFLLLGLSVYLYLPLRSVREPLINWNKPDNLEALKSTLMRKTHGGTLDLISAGYQKGENLLDGLKHFISIFSADTLYVGFGIFLLGGYWIYRLNKKLLLFIIMTIIFSGLLFIYLANMPPNPHALAILEAHFMLPYLFLFFGVSGGLLYLVKLKKELTIVIPIFAILIFFNNYRWLNKRYNFFTYDYARNIRISARPNSIVVLKEDVQLFTMWYNRYIKKHRPDLVIIAQGLSGSPWFMEKIKNEDENVFLTRLNDESTWQDFITNNRKPIYISGDVDYKTIKNIQNTPNGLLTILSQNEIQQNADILLKELYTYRGKYRYTEYREFFTPDLIEEYLKANLSIANYHVSKNNLNMASDYLLTSQMYNLEAPHPVNIMAYLHYSNGNLQDSEYWYKISTKLFEDLLKKAYRYKAMPDVVESIKKETADAYLNLGVVKEKMRKLDESLNAYDTALKYNPYCAQAYFNKGVIFWHMNDWKNVVLQLENALRINPNYTEAYRYLTIAKERLKGK